MSESLPDRRDLDAELLAELESVGCDHTSGLAQMVGAPLSTVRRHLEAMQERGLIDGILHDERDILPNGRRRVYWSMKWSVKS
jgi:DNA-binding Lrp family transcriptional regulator